MARDRRDGCPGDDDVLRRALATLAAALLLLGGGVAAAGAAAAGGVVAAEPPAGCSLVEVRNGDTIEYDVVCPGDDGGGADGGGGGGEPACELRGMYDYCIGTSACWANVPSALAPETWPEETRPSPEAIYTYQSCDPDPGGTLTGWSWYTPDEVSVAELARQAFGSLATPTFSIAFNPPRRAVVGLDTWFWAQTEQVGTISGSPAMGVVAFGEPDRIEVDPGDGSDVRTCPWTTSESQACAHEYTRSSAGRPTGSSGLPSYTARMRLVYDVRFENNGAPLAVGGLPATLESAWQTVDVPVAEIQSIVTSSGDAPQARGEWLR